MYFRHHNHIFAMELLIRIAVCLFPATDATDIELQNSKYVTPPSNKSTPTGPLAYTHTLVHELFRVVKKESEELSGTSVLYMIGGRITDTANLHPAPNNLYDLLSLHDLHWNIRFLP